MTRRVLPAAVVALAVVVVLRWLTPGGPGGRMEIAPPDPRFDYALTDFSVRFHDADGRPGLHLSAPRLEHSEQSREALIEHPRFSVPAPDGDWSGRADRALIRRDLDELILTGAVEIGRPMEDGSLSVRSERIDYRPATGQAVSPGPAAVTRTVPGDEAAGTEIRGGTLSVWLNQQRVELENHVEAVYRAAGPGAERGSD